MRKKMMPIILMTAMMTIATACSSDDPLGNYGDNTVNGNGDTNSNSNNGGSTTSTYAEIKKKVA